MLNQHDQAVDRRRSKVRFYILNAQRFNVWGQFTEPISPNTHLASAGMVFTTTSDNWEYEPILGVHVYKGNTIDADYSVFPMELIMALTAALVIAKHYLY